MSKPIPRFESEADEQAFRSDNDSTEFVDWDAARPVVLPAVKPSTKAVSLRLPEHLIDNLKVLAHKRDVSYQSLLKLYLAERVEAELRAGQEAA